MKKKENIVREAKLVTKPVAWAGEKVIKHQSMLEYPVSEGRTLRIVGDPASSKNSAMDNLYTELTLWQGAIAEFDKVLRENDL